VVRTNLPEDGPELDAFLARQQELAPAFFSLWLAPWVHKRAYLERIAGLAEVIRHVYAAYVLYPPAQHDDRSQFWRALVKAHLPLLERCELAHEAGGEVEIFDAIFADRELSTHTGQPHGTSARELAAQPVGAEVAWPPPLPAPTDPGFAAFNTRSAELGDLLLSMWFASWQQKRTFVERVPDLADPHRHMLGALTMRKTPIGEEVAAVMRAHLPLLERCKAAFVASRRGGVAYAAALDEIFDDHSLWLPFRASTGQPLE
jgi:hypothetical protein